MERVGRGRLSSIDLLPEEARDDIIWACTELNQRARTQADILFELNDRLEAKGIPGISRSAFNRKAMRLAAAARRMDETRHMFEGLAKHLTPERVDDNAIVLGEFLKTLIFELMEEGSGDRTPKEAMELARAYLAAIQGQRLSADRRRKLEAEFAEKTEQTIETVVQQAGLSKERAAQIRREVLGVRS